jgi:hypothetical protein
VDGAAGGLEDGARPAGRVRGKEINSAPLWLGFCALFFFGLADLRRPLSLRNLDLLALLSFSVSLWYFNRGDVFTSVPLAYPPMVYLLGRMLWSAGRGRLRTGAVPVWPVWALAAAAVFAGGFRIGLNLQSSNVIDVGYSGVVGADRIARGQVPYGNFPVEGSRKACGPADSEGEIRNRIQKNGRCESANPEGDTYGPSRTRRICPATSRSAGAASGTTFPRRTSRRSCSTCSACSALRSSGCASAAAPGGRRSPSPGSLPVHAVRLELEHERRAAAALPDLGLLVWRPRRPRAASASRSRAGRSSPRCSWRRSGPRTRARLRPTLRLRAAFLAATLVAFSILCSSQPGPRGTRLLGPHARLADRAGLAVLALGLAPVPRGPA